MSARTVPVVVQLIRIGVHDAALRWCSARAPLHDAVAPDDLARTLSGLASEVGASEGLALHSTSWRHQDATVVLTYALFPAPDASPHWARLAQHVAVSAGPIHPAPPCLSDDHVAAHAARHLADLAGGRDPHMLACTGLRPHPWRLLLRHAAGVHAQVPGSTHQHELTRRT